MVVLPPVLVEIYVEVSAVVESVVEVTAGVVVVKDVAGVDIPGVLVDTAVVEDDPAVVHTQEAPVAVYPK